MSAKSLKFRSDPDHDHDQNDDGPRRLVWLFCLSAFAFCAVAGVGFVFLSSTDSSANLDLKGLRTTLDPRCSVRGLIAADGARTYQTNQFVRNWFIDSSLTERWFCSEVDARAAGFRRVD